MVVLVLLTSLSCVYRTHREVGGPGRTVATAHRPGQLSKLRRQAVEGRIKTYRDTPDVSKFVARYRSTPPTDSY